MKDLKSKYLKEMSDDENPEYLFNGVSTKLMVAIANGKLDAKKLAKKQLVNRGLGKKGEWIGFPQAEKLWGVK